MKINQSDLDKTLNSLQDQINIANMVGEFSKPIGGFINYSPKITNRSEITFNVSKPPQSLTRKASVGCMIRPGIKDILSPNSGIALEPTVTLSNIPESVKSIGMLLTNCFPSDTQNNLNLIVGPNESVNVSFVASYLIEFVPNTLSKWLILFEAIVLSAAFLRVIKELMVFVKKGFEYFVD